MREALESPLFKDLQALNTPLSDDERASESSNWKIFRGLSRD
jgi:hypothetical protein